MPTDLLLVTRPQPGCAVLTLNRPQALNALSHALRQAIADAAQALAADPEVRVLVLTGAGRAFCAGLDLKELGQTGLSDAAADPVAALEAFPGPVIGAVHGVAITGGFELALACDLLLASTEARFADTHARIGVMPGWGLSQKLPRLIGRGRAREMAFSGNFIDAATAERWGLVNRVLPEAELLPAALALAADMVSALPEALRAYKRVLNEGECLPLGEALALEKRHSRDWARHQSAEALEQRRTAVQARGREQTQ